MMKKTQVKKFLLMNWVELLSAVVFIAGVVVICIFPSRDLSLNEKISSGVLWLTALVIVFYTVETRRLRVETGELKKVSSRQLGLEEEIMMNEFLPIVEPEAAGLQGGDVYIRLRNHGRGVAQSVRILFGKTEAAGGFSIPGKDKRELHWYQDPEIVKLTKDSTTDTVIKVLISYMDIYHRRFETRGAYFSCDEPSPRDRFQLNQDAWEFVKLPKAKTLR